MLGELSSWLRCGTARKPSTGFEVEEKALGRARECGWLLRRWMSHRPFAISSSRGFPRAY